MGSWVAFAPWYGLGYCPCADSIGSQVVAWANGSTEQLSTYLFDAWTGIR